MSEKTAADKARRQEIKNAFFAEWELNGGNASKAARAVGATPGNARKWVIKQLGHLVRASTVSQAAPTQSVAQSITDSKVRVGAIRFISVKGVPRKHFVIPDVQAKKLPPGLTFDYLRKIGELIVQEKPDVLVFIGDWDDLPAFSSYDKGKKSFEGRSYVEDFQAGREAQAALFGPILRERERITANNLPAWDLVAVITYGNHEHRMHRAIDLSRELTGLLHDGLFDWKKYGVIEVPFLAVANIDGVHYSHYHTTGVMGRPAASAKAMIKQKHVSCVMGHVQKSDIASEPLPDGRHIHGIFVSSCYEHDEDYLGPQGNNYFRGVWIFDDVLDGDFTIRQISLKQIHNRFK